MILELDEWLLNKEEEEQQQLVMLQLLRSIQWYGMKLHTSKKATLWVV